MRPPPGHRRRASPRETRRPHGTAAGSTRGGARRPRPPSRRGGDPAGDRRRSSRRGAVACGATRRSGANAVSRAVRRCRGGRVVPPPRGAGPKRRPRAPIEARKGEKPAGPGAEGARATASRRGSALIPARSSGAPTRRRTPGPSGRRGRRRVHSTRREPTPARPSLPRRAPGPSRSRVLPSLRRLGLAYPTPADLGRSIERPPRHPTRRPRSGVRARKPSRGEPSIDGSRRSGL